MNDYAVYFKQSNGMFRTLKNNDEAPLSLHYNNFKIIPRRYECFNGYTADDEGLIQFNNDLLQWREELKNNPVFKIDWLNFYTNGLAIKNTFIFLLNGDKQLWTKMNNQGIDAVEASYIESCFNTGITKLFVEPAVYNCYGYDFTGFYPSIMSNDMFEIPIGKGREIFLDNLPSLDNIPYGHYYCKIECNNLDFQKIFAFSKNNCYTHYCLAVALKYQKQFNVMVSPTNDDNKYKAYIYDNTISSSLLFKKWYTTLSKIKALYPNNRLVKYMTSSLWSQLCSFNKLCIPATEIDKYDMTKYTILDSENINSHLEGNSACGRVLQGIPANNVSPYYNLRDDTKFYKYNIRLKSFLTSYGRCKIGEVALRNLSQVIAIQTDGIVFSSQQNFSDIAGLRPDAKTTGCIHWHNSKNKTKL